MTKPKNNSLQFKWDGFGMGVYLVVLGLLLAYLLLSVWPAEWPMDQRSTTAQPAQPAATPETVSPDTARRPTESALTVQPPTTQPSAKRMTDEPRTRGGTIGLLWGWFRVPDTSDLRLMLVVLIMGAIGSYVHVGASFIYHIGAKDFSSYWVWWYILRPFIGTALALVFYLVVRGGLLAAEGNNLNLYGTAAVAGLVGLSSKQAVERLKDLFNTLFGQSDKATSPEATPGGGKPPPRNPTITKTDPVELIAGTEERKITVTGAGFVEKSQVTFDNDARDTRYVNDTTLEVTATDADLSKPGTIAIRVKNPDGGESAPFSLEVREG